MNWVKGKRIVTNKSNPARKPDENPSIGLDVMNQEQKKKNKCQNNLTALRA